LYGGDRPTELMSDFHSKLIKRDDQLIEFKTLLVLNEIIKLNPFVYKKEHGIRRKKEEVNYINFFYGSRFNLDTRECTLEIDDVKNLKSIAKYTSESLNRHNLSYVSGLVSLLNLAALKEFMPVEEYYTLDYLYTNKYKYSGKTLVDYGLDLIQEKYHKIKEIRDASNDHDKLKEIADQISGLFVSDEELKIVLSIGQNIKQIRKEKEIHSCMIDAIEYMMDDTDILGKKDEPKTAKIESDLSNFDKDYISGATGLNKTVSERRSKLTKKRRMLEEEKIECEEKRIQKLQKKTSSTSNVSDQNESRTVADIENDMVLLDWDLEKEALQYSNVCKLLSRLSLLSDISPIQKEYIVKNIEEFVQMRDATMRDAKMSKVQEIEE
ncbi:hypothetical protein NEMIN01_2506, partial [Nematocida minor]|uniref:uncharacterized protein n=1 Tax=Nematocida minor TaxID=1912983 RepID=UPI0022206162